jgi:hypothetical protein
MNDGQNNIAGTVCSAGALAWLDDTFCDDSR